MVPTVSSSGTPGGQTGATMAVATCPSVIGIDSWRPGLVFQGGTWWIPVSLLKVARGSLLYGNARRTSVAGFVVPSTEETAVEKERPWYVRLLQCGNGYIIKPK